MNNNHIDYIEFQATDFDATKKFYGEVFGWEFTDWGDSYISFENSGVLGGFTLVGELSSPKNNPLVVIYHEKLDEIKETITKAGGIITIDTFSFPGGQRFQFSDPNDNELAVWTKE